MARHEQFTVGSLLVGSINGIPWPNFGKSHYLIPADSATSLYRNWLVSNGVNAADIHLTLTAAEDAMAADRGDILFVFPGDHVQTVSMTWDKSNTIIQGVGSPNQGYQPGTLTVGGTRITCKTADITQILNITGDYVQLYGIGTHNSYAGALNLSDIKVVGKNLYAENCSFRGGSAATQIATDGAGVPIIFAGGNAAKFKNCWIGSSGNTVRTKGPGCLQFSSSGGGTFAPEFENCRFTTRIETANANHCSMVYIVDNGAVDRTLLFKDCFFYNFVENLASKLDYCVNDGCATTHITAFVNCSLFGVDAWSNTTTYTYVASGPVQHAEGGIAVVGDIS